MLGLLALLRRSHLDLDCELRGEVEVAGIDGKETRERRFCWLVPCVIFLCSSRAPTPSSSSESGHLRPCAQVGVEVDMRTYSSFSISMA
jgi:hypothetical protein